MTRMSEEALAARLRSLQGDVAAALDASCEVTSSFDGREGESVAALRALRSAVAEVGALLDASAHLPLRAVPIRLDLLLQKNESQRLIDDAARAINRVRWRRGSVPGDVMQKTLEDAYELADAYPLAVTRMLDEMAKLCRKIAIRRVDSLGA